MARLQRRRRTVKFNVPDYRSASSTGDYTQLNFRSHALPVGGYLLAITIKPAIAGISPNDHEDYKALFRIGNAAGDQIFGEFKWARGMPQCGIAFHEPLPNFNAQAHYTLMRCGDDIQEQCPILLVTTVTIAVK